MNSAIAPIAGWMRRESAKAQIIKRIAVMVMVMACVVVAGPCLAGGGQSASVRNCTWCHGTPAQGFMVAPRLAGQRRQYIEEQLQSFYQHTRDDPLAQQYMWSAVAALRPDAARDLATYFSLLPAQAANDGHGDAVAAGRKIFMEGIPEANIVSCYACHGPDAEGVREIPRLGGLSYTYLKRRLQQWSQGYHSSSGSPMPMVASTLGPDEVEALASYLSFVK
jgi:cytochrome c553